MKKARLIIASIACLALVACNSGNGRTGKLAGIDRLLKDGAVDSAYAEICGIGKDDICNTADSAFFFLLQTEAAYRLYKPEPPMKCIDFAIRHYSKGNRDKEKLARAYFYKGSILYNRNNVKDGLEFIKNAEFIADKTKNHELKHKIYEALVVINEEAGEDNTAMKYARRSVNEAKVADKKNWLAHAYNNMAVIYGRLDKQDSSEFYLKKSMALLKAIPEKDRLFIINNVGVYLLQHDKEKAKRYFKQILETAPFGEAYENLASIYADEGNDSLAEVMWNKAVAQGSTQVKEGVLRTMFGWQKERSDFAAAAATAERLMALKDSIAKTRNGNDVKTIQTEFDSIKSKQEYERNIALFIALLVITALSASIAILHFRYKQYKTKAVMAHDQMLIKSYEAQIAELQRLDEDKEKEIEAIRRRKEKLLDKHRNTLNHGYQLFSEIQNGKSTVLWKKNDFENVIEYYRLVDIEFIDTLDNSYEDLSPKYKFFMILSHEGKTDSEIMSIMGVAEVSLRSIRSRINKKKKKL